MIYRTFHTVPKLFSESEVKLLNESRPKDDQLELMSSGLLKHHCCYPNCPEYLQDQRTDFDRGINTHPEHKKHTRKPDIYTKEEIKSINKLRPNSDKVTIDSHGHIVGRCDIKDCPMYLKKFKFNKKSETRHGIYKHLNPDIYNSNLFSGFHSNGIMYKRKSNTFDEFVEKMKTKYSFDMDDKYQKELLDIWNFSIYS
jgi:hypothetical protein